MQLRAIANQVSNTVNQNLTISLQTSNGSVIGAGQRQVPQYNPVITGPAQIQALDNSDLKKMEGLNLQGTLRALYMYGSLAGVIRPDSKGGDLVTINAPAPLLYRGTWLVTKVLESWQDWTKVCIVKQTGQIAVPSTINLSVTAPAPGNFTVPHGLGKLPSSIRLVMTSGGSIWAQTPAFDLTNLYLAASDAALTCNVWVIG